MKTFRTVSLSTCAALGCALLVAAGAHPAQAAALPISGPLVAITSSTAFQAFVFSGNNVVANGVHPSLSTAAGKAAVAILPAPGETGEATVGSRCLTEAATSSPSGAPYVSLAACGADHQQWQRGYDNSLRMVDGRAAEVAYLGGVASASIGARATLTDTALPIAAAPIALPLSIEAPAEDALITSATGRVDFAGTGAAGATIRLVTKSGAVLADDIVVPPNGHWSRSTWRAVPAAYTVTATQTVKGESPTSMVAHYTLRLAAPVDLPFAITGPDEDAQLANPAGRVTFTGTGTHGSTVTALRGNGSVVGPADGTTVEDDGHWSFTTWLPNSTRYTVTFRENGTDPRVVHFDLDRR